MATLETPKVAAAGERHIWISAEAWQQIRDYGPTFATEFAIMASLIFTYKLAAHFLGKQGFSEYAVARRVISTIYPIALLGFGVAMPRYIALSGEEYQGKSSERFFGAAFWCVGLVTMTLLGVVNLFPSQIAYLVYGSREYASFVFPISLVIGGLTLHALCYAYFRGHLRMAPANTLQFANLAVVPVLAFYLGGRTTVEVLERIGWFTVLVSLTALWWMPWRALGSKCLVEARTLLRYGVPRIPGDFAQMALLGLPTFFVAHKAGVQQAGFVALGISVLSMINAIFAPAGIILLPAASRMISEGARSELRQHVLGVAGAAAIISGTIVLTVLIFAKPIIVLFLGAGFGDAVQFVRILALGAIPLSVYSAVRGLIDARHVRALNTYNNLIALAVFCAGGGFAMVYGGAVATTLMLVISLWVLGILTVREARRIIAS